MDNKRLDILIARIKESGDETAFAEFYELTSKGLFSYLLSIVRIREVAEDLADTTVTDAMKKVLTADEAQIVMLYVVAGFKHREIAEIVKKPVGTVLWTYNNSLKKLRKYLKEEQA